MEFNKNSHCSYCGAYFLEQTNWPRKCVVCQNESYINPVPVVVTLLDVWKYRDRGAGEQAGILIQKRNINPKKGEWALSGGYVNAFEKWQDAAARELREEIGLIVDPMSVKLFDTVSNDKNHVLIFNYLEQPVYMDEIHFSPNNEVSMIDVVYQPVSLAFPIHTLMMSRYVREIPVKYSNS